YQRLWMHEHLRHDIEANQRRKSSGTAKPSAEELEPAGQQAEDERIKAAFESLRGAGNVLEYVYSREEQFQADLFAIHLCRNAGCDLETCLDSLRRKAVGEDAALLAPHPPRQGNPPVEPEVQPRAAGEALTLANHPTAAQRLRRLRLELDGLIYA